MEVQLQEIIEKIKNDGVVAAEEEAKSIIASARAEAEKILKDAKTEADKILVSTRTETERITRSSEDAIRQAGRNMLISFRESVARELKAITEKGASEALSSGSLEDIIVSTVKCWAADPDIENIEVILSKDSLEKMENTILAALKDKISKGVILKASDSFDGGFRISSDKDRVYYDYSLDAVVDMISGYLSPRIIRLLKEAE